MKKTITHSLVAIIATALVTTTQSCNFGISNNATIDSGAVATSYFKAHPDKNTTDDSLIFETYTPSKSNRAFKTVTGGGVEITEVDLARKWVTNFQKQNTSGIFRTPIRTGYGEPIKSLFLSKEIINTIVQRGGDEVNGFKFFFAKLDTTPRKAYTMVVMGTKSVTDPSHNGVVNMPVPGWGVFEHLDPCPGGTGTDCPSIEFPDDVNTVAPKTNIKK